MPISITIAWLLYRMPTPSQNVLLWSLGMPTCHSFRP